jgi:hypothetical protein
MTRCLFWLGAHDVFVGAWDGWSALRLWSSHSGETPHTATFRMRREDIAACVVMWGVPRLLLPGSSVATLSYAAELAVLYADTRWWSPYGWPTARVWNVRFVAAYTLARIAIACYWWRACLLRGDG